LDEQDRELDAEEDLDELIAEVLDQGREVAFQFWDSGAPGAGAGEVSVYEHRGKFYLFDDLGMHGPFETKGDAKDQGCVEEINEATREIWDAEKGITFRRRER
jgi:hypothetical protein